MSDRKKLTLSLDVLIWSLFTALYCPMFLHLYMFGWHNTDYTHAYAVLPVSLFLAWRKRHEVIKARGCAASIKDKAWGYPLVALATLLLMSGWHMELLVLASLSIIPMLYGIILHRYNGQVARILTFPILYLLLLVPPPSGVIEAMTMALRNIVASAATTILGLFFHVRREGLMLTIDQTRIFIGAPCSGFRSMTALFALTLVYTHVMGLKTATRRILLASVIPLAFLGNLLFWAGRS